MMSVRIKEEIALNSGSLKKKGTQLFKTQSVENAAVQPRKDNLYLFCLFVFCF